MQGATFTRVNGMSIIVKLQGEPEKSIPKRHKLHTSTSLFTYVIKYLFMWFMAS